MAAERNRSSAAARAASGSRPAGPRADRQRTTSDIPPLEWVAAAVGFALFAATLVFLIVRGLENKGSPPDISVRSEAVAEVQSGYVVTIRAVNRGARTAADVKIEGALKSERGVVETAETTFKYIPSNAERRGGLFFSNDPRRHQLTLQPKGFEDP